MQSPKDITQTQERKNKPRSPSHLPRLGTHGVSLAQVGAASLCRIGTLKGSVMQQMRKRASVLIPASAEMIRHNQIV